MRHSKRSAPSRRTFLKTAAGVAAGTILAPRAVRAGAQSAAVTGSGAFPGIEPRFMISPELAWQWNAAKARMGPTYAGSPGWKSYTDFLTGKMSELGAVDLDFVEIPYDHYIVDDWPDGRTHLPDAPHPVEKLVSDGTPVAVVASYGMTSGFTAPEGVTAPMVYWDAARPPADDQVAGRILVCQTAPYPDPPYDGRFLDSYTPTDYEWRSPGKWPELFLPVPASVMSSYHSRWVWGQLGRFAAAAIKARAAALVVVYDLSPGAAFSLAQRSVYTATGRAGLNAEYVNCPTLTLDRVNGAKVVADARAGRTATLTLEARFQRDTGKAIVAYLPGKDYGTAADRQVLLATHTDAMSLVEENGGLGLLGIMSYFNHLPRQSRARTLIFYFDCRHFMPGGEGSWPQFDYYTVHPDRLSSIVATMGVEHMGGRQTVETGEGGNDYVYSKERPEDGGVITSLMDIYNNNIWLVEAIARAATVNHWPRVDVKAGDVEPGVNGGFQGRVKSPMNKGRTYKIPGIGLAGDWPGGWTQTYAQLDTEAGPHGFDETYFTQQVAGLSQLAGELMRVDPRVIDLGWGEIKSAIVKLPDSSFVDPPGAAAARQGLVDQYVSVFRRLESGGTATATDALGDLSRRVAAVLVPEARPPLDALVAAQREKLS